MIFVEYYGAHPDDRGGVTYSEVAEAHTVYTLAWREMFSEFYGGHAHADNHVIDWLFPEAYREADIERFNGRWEWHSEERPV